jgi:hypothetical protein
MRFKKLEAPDLIEEIIRTRLPQPIFAHHHHHQNNQHHQGSGASTSGEPMSANSLSSPPPSSTITASTVMMGLSVDTLPGDRQITFMQSQLIFEMYQKNQLVQRLGSLLRDRIATSGAEADKQNLVRIYRSVHSTMVTADFSTFHRHSSDLLNRCTKYGHSKVS